MSTHHLHQMFMIHSPYPDGTWRGLEKCAVSGDGPRTFDTIETATAKLSAMDAEIRPHFQVVEVTLVIPHVRGDLDSATWDRVRDVFRGSKT